MFEFDYPISSQIIESFLKITIVNFNNSRYIKYENNKVLIDTLITTSNIDLNQNLAFEIDNAIKEDPNNNSRLNTGFIIRKRAKRDAKEVALRKLERNQIAARENEGFNNNNFQEFVGRIERAQALRLEQETALRARENAFN